MSELTVSTPLSSDEDTFALAVIEYGGNLGAAYKSVFGQDVSNAGVKARNLITRPEIAKRIQELTVAVEEHALVSLGSHLVKLAEIRDIAIDTGQLKVALGAETKRGEAAGFYTKHQAPKGGDDRPAVNVFIGSSPGSVQDWGTKHGKMPVIVENGK